MRCYCCNVLLSDYEATRRSHETGEFVDMCNPCFAHMGDIWVDERVDLRHNDDSLEGDEDE